MLEQAHLMLFLPSVRYPRKRTSSAKQENSADQTASLVSINKYIPKTPTISSIGFLRNYSERPKIATPKHT